MGDWETGRLGDWGTKIFICRVSNAQQLGFSRHYVAHHLDFGQF
jgi:hypothetical protein